MRVLICCILLFCKSHAQTFYFPADSAAIRAIDLPKEQPFDSSHAFRKINDSTIYIVSDHDLYDLFGYDKAAALYDLNFKEQHILGTYICRHCIDCYYNGHRVPCHRNACDYEWRWVIRDNNKAFEKVDHNAQPNGGEDGRSRKDTLLFNAQDSVVWFTTGHGDCFAQFEYEVIRDKYRPIIVLKEYNYWGGCRAGGSKSAVIRFRKSTHITQMLKRTILMDKKIK